MHQLNHTLVIHLSNVGGMMMYTCGVVTQYTRTNDDTIHKDIIMMTPHTRNDDIVDEE